MSDRALTFKCRISTIDPLEFELLLSFIYYECGFDHLLHDNQFFEKCLGCPIPTSPDSLDIYIIYNWYQKFPF